MGFLDNKEKKVGFYSTVIFHLVVLILFLLTAIHRVVSEETSFVLDFSKQEEMEEMEKQEELKEKASRDIEDLLSGKTAVNTYRNVAVDRSAKPLKDDRFKNPNQVYDEARDLQRKLDASRREAMKEQGADDEVAAPVRKGDEDTDAPKYTGPSVISYRLDGRKAMSLPIPVYKCFGGGDVAVRIVVNPKGYVIAASVIEGSSSTDECLQEYAVKAAKKSRFTAAPKAPSRQAGEIVYRFIAQ